MRSFIRLRGMLWGIWVLASLFGSPSHAEETSSKIRFRAATMAEIEALGLRTPGALVVESVPAGGRHGLQEKDVITFALAKPVTRLADLIAAVEAALTLDMLPLPDESPQTPPVGPAVPMAVAANQAWTRTGITLQNGMTVTIQASGTIEAASAQEEQAYYYQVPPEGRIQRRGSFPAPSLPGLALLGRCDSGPIFLVGSGSQFQVDANSGSGEFLLGINDDSLADNSGAWMVSITVTGQEKPSLQSPPDPPDSPSAWLGIIALTGMNKKRQPQVEVVWVEQGSPAEKSLQPGDILLTAENTPLAGIEAITALLARKSPGEQITFSVERSKKTQTIALPLGRLSPSSPRTILVAGAFRGESYTGGFQACLDANRQKVYGVMKGSGLGSLNGTFEGRWDPGTGGVDAVFKGKASLLFKVDIRGAIRGQADRSGRGSGIFEGSSGIAVERGIWTCEAITSPQVQAL